MDLNEFMKSLHFSPDDPEQPGGIPYDYRRVPVKAPKPPQRTAGRPTKSLSDRLTMADAFAGTDELADPYDPLSFNESNWSANTGNRRSWIENEYKGKYGQKTPWKMEDATRNKRAWIADDLEETYGTKTPWDSPKWQDKPGQTRTEWMNYKPKDRYPGSERSALLPEVPH